MATSSKEAEYIAAAECCKELIYIKTLIEEITDNKISITLNIDNQSAINIIKNRVVSNRSKHIDVRFYFIKEKMDEGLINIKYCPTNFQIADIFTKPLGPNKFEKFKEKLVM